jgi:hypothetical protein
MEKQITVIVKWTLLFCARRRRHKITHLIINNLAVFICFFGSCGCIFHACLCEKTRTEVEVSAFKLFK